MPANAVHRHLLLTDLADSTGLAARLGEAGAAAWWTAHDRMARDLLREWRGREIDKSDGFLLLFERGEDALGYAQAYHTGLAALSPPLHARAGLHCGAVLLRENPADDVARGAKPLEVDGAAKPAAARIMAAARPGQTLLSGAARDALHDAAAGGLRSHGHWCFKGLDEAIELFEPAGADGAAGETPPDGAKGWRVVRHGDLWLPARELPHSLPAERDRFVGRGAALDDLRARFERGARLVSLLGTGGTGKTRLALRLGWRRLGDFPGGVWFCDLSAARSVDGIVHATAHGLQIALSGADPVRQIGDAIAGRGECLVIADNFEQVARHAEATLGRWLERAPQARFLVTTREVLGIPGEDTLALPPLPGDDGARLLRDRAAAAGASAFSAADEAAVPELVKLLDGLPLAIELAASRMRVLPPARLLPRMGERFKLLAAAQGRHDRQATLRAALDWSWELLNDAERSALAQLSVFEGGFTLEAAEAVVDLSAFEPAPWVVDVVQALVDKSLVRRVGESRLDLLRSVQDYANDMLLLGASGGHVPTGSEQKVFERHFLWAASLDEVAAVADRCINVDNFVAALRRACADGPPAAIVGALRTAWAALNLCGPYSLALELAEAVLQSVPAGGDLGAEVRCIAGTIHTELGRYREAEALLRDGLSNMGSTASRRVRAELQGALASLMSRTGRTDEAAEHFQCALSVARQVGDDRRLLCKALARIGAWHLEESRLDEAHALLSEALGLARQLGDMRWIGGLTGNLAQLLHERGDVAGAKSLYEAALECACHVGDRKFEGNSRCNYGLLMFEAGLLTDARTELAAGLAIARSLGHSRLEYISSWNLGLVAEAEGRVDDGVSHLEHAASVARAQGLHLMEAQIVAVMARLQARNGNRSLSLACLERAQTLVSASDDDSVLCVIHCCAGEVLWHADRPAEAQLHHGAAKAGIARLGPGPGSELVRHLQSLEDLLSSHPTPAPGA